MKKIKIITAILLLSISIIVNAQSKKSSNNLKTPKYNSGYFKYSGYSISLCNKNLVLDSEWSNSEKLDVNFKIKDNKIKIKTDSIEKFIITNFYNEKYDNRDITRCIAIDKNGIECNVIIDINNIPIIYLFIFYSDKAFAYSLYSTKEL